jgi:hypothetical protein
MARSDSYQILMSGVLKLEIVCPYLFVAAAFDEDTLPIAFVLSVVCVGLNQLAELEYVTATETTGRIRSVIRWSLLTGLAYTAAYGVVWFRFTSTIRFSRLLELEVVVFIAILSLRLAALGLHHYLSKRVGGERS